MEKLTESEFLKIVKKTNPHLNFDKVVYKSLSAKVIVTCPKHGDFEMQANSLKRRTVTCPMCDLEERKNAFIEKARQVHGDKYIYDKIDYKTNKIPVEIVCPEHGSFMQAPGDHLKGWGCSKCSGKYKPTTEEWIERAKKIHGDKYDYSKVEYKDNKTPVIIICKKHNREFSVIPNNFINDIYNCPECRKEYKQELYSKTTEEFIEDARKVHGDLYNYSKVKYTNNKEKVCIICPEHGEFWQQAGCHIAGAGCPKCRNKNQTKLFNILVENFPEATILYETSTEWLDRLRFDMYFPEYNIAVEYDGMQHFVPIERFGGKVKFKQTQEWDKKKNRLCEENNCTLFRLKYNYTKEELNKLILSIKDIIQYKKCLVV